MDLTHYRFRSVWTLDASLADTYAALHDVSQYPRWWPEVKEARRVDEDSVELVCRSFLPYDLRFVIQRAVADERAGILEATLRGDLEGFSRWMLKPGDDGVRARFVEDVTTKKPILNLFAPLARPAFVANHAWMMRDGEIGLRIYLAGYRKGRVGL